MAKESQSSIDKLLAAQADLERKLEGIKVAIEVLQGDSSSSSSTKQKQKAKTKKRASKNKKSPTTEWLEKACANKITKTDLVTQAEKANLSGTGAILVVQKLIDDKVKGWSKGKVENHKGKGMPPVWYKFSK